MHQCISLVSKRFVIPNPASEGDGKKTLLRVTNEFTDAKTEVFKVVTSEDNGATWNPMLQGVARKVGD